MMTDAERDRLRALAGGSWPTPQTIELTLFCDRCGAKFVGNTLTSDCPHCNVIGDAR